MTSQPLGAAPADGPRLALTERVKRLRELSREAEVWIDPERARVITAFYRENDGKYSIPVLRALALKDLFQKKELYLGDDELIVGERGSAPKRIPTFPEIACHSLEDLEMLASQRMIPYNVSDETKDLYKNEVIPYWRGRSLRDRVFGRLEREWMDIYESGLITETLEQRAPGSMALDGKIYGTGLLGIKEEIKSAAAALDFMNDPEASDKREELTAMDIACDALILYAKRYAELLAEKAALCADGARRAELEKMADVCRRVPAHAPRDLWEALQTYWFLHVGVVTEANGWDGCNPGHIDRHFYPFYKKDVESGALTKGFAKELLCAWWIKFNNHPAPAKYGVSALESGTYNDFVNISLGGMTPEGADAVNELSYVFLDILDEIEFIQPQAHILLSRVNSDEFLKYACRVIRKGRGFPAVFNADAAIEQQLRTGKTLADARGGGVCGCVETTCYGKEAAPLIGYINFPKILELALHDGVDPRTKRRIGPASGAAADFADYDELIAAFKLQAKHVIETKLRGTQYLERMFAEYLPQSFLSSLIEGCVAKGRNYNDGGPKYSISMLPGVGIGTVTDSLAAIKKHVFDEGRYTLAEAVEALDGNFEGRGEMRAVFANRTPRYGNDDDYADAIMKEVSDYFIDAVDGRPDSRGGTYRMDMLPTTCHMYFGEMTLATADGRAAFTPLSEGISPVQGADRGGPTAVLKSAAKMDHARTCGTLLNMKFLPDALKDENGIQKLAGLIRTYFRFGGYHLQFNVCDAETLRGAQREPEKYRNLIVRVAGYSDYFNAVGRSLQDEIIRRTAHS